MTQADKYFANNGRYEQRIIEFSKEITNIHNREEASKLILKFTNNTQLHLVGMKLEPSDAQYLEMITVEGMVNLIKKQVNK